MVRVLITGVSGAGKTTLLDALSARGHHTVDTDDGGWRTDSRQERARRKWSRPSSAHDAHVDRRGA